MKKRYLISIVAQPLNERLVDTKVIGFCRSHWKDRVLTMYERDIKIPLEIASGINSFCFGIELK